MTAPRWETAATVRQALGPLDPESAAPSGVRELVGRLASDTVYARWCTPEAAPTVRMLRVACGQIAAARPGGDARLRLMHLSEDCAAAKDTTCPDQIAAVYTALARSIPPQGTTPELRAHVLEPDLFLCGLQELSVLAAAAACLARDDGPESRGTSQ